MLTQARGLGAARVAESPRYLSWGTAMRFIDFEGSSRLARGDRASVAGEAKRSADRGVAPSISYLPRNERASAASSLPATHVVFDPFAHSRRRSFAEGRVYTPYGRF